jgi:hypothetical protein
MSQIIMMAKKLQDAEELIARLQAGGQLGGEATDGNLKASRTEPRSEEPSPAGLSAAEQRPGPVSVTATSTVLNATQVKLSEVVDSRGPISDLSLDENGKICYCGPTSAVHDPVTMDSTHATDHQYDSPSVRFSLRSMLTSSAMESRAWEAFAVGNAAIRTDIPQATMSKLLKIHWSWIAPMFMWMYRPAFMREHPKALHRTSLI